MAKQILGAVMTGGTATFMARVTGHLNEAITRADIEAVEYSIFRVEDTTRIAVDEHQAVAVAVADVMTESLVATEPWTKDAIGYNFLHVLPIADNPAFADPLTRYVVDYILTPASGEPIVVSFLPRTLQ